MINYLWSVQSRGSPHTLHPALVHIRHGHFTSTTTHTRSHTYAYIPAMDTVSRTRKIIGPLERTLIFVNGLLIGYGGRCHPGQR